MDKDKILSKARAEKKDEREEQIEIKSFKIGWYGVTIMITILLGMQLYFNQPNSTELNLVFMGHFLSATFFKYKEMGFKSYLVASFILLGGIAMGFASLLTQYGVF